MYKKFSYQIDNQLNFTLHHSPEIIPQQIIPPKITHDVSIYLSDAFISLISNILTLPIIYNYDNYFFLINIYILFHYRKLFQQKKLYHKNYCKNIIYTSQKIIEYENILLPHFIKHISLQNNIEKLQIENTEIYNYIHSYNKFSIIHIQLLNSYINYYII